jgi:hypothetical protein
MGAYGNRQVNPQADVPDNAARWKLVCRPVNFDPVQNTAHRPKAYQVTELEIINEEAWKTFSQAVRASQQTAGGRNLRTAKGKVVGFVGTRRSMWASPSSTVVI